MLNKNDYYRTYITGDDIAVYFPNGEKHLINDYDATYAFRNFSPEMVSDDCFYFKDSYEARKFESQVCRLEQEYYYTVRRFFH